MSLATVEVRGTFLRADSTPEDPKPLTGAVEFVLTAPLQDGAGDVIYEPVLVSVDLDEDGHFAVDLVATDATGGDPDNVRYRVTLRLSDPATGHKYLRPPWLLEVPEDSPGGFIDLADVAAAIDVDLTFTYVLKTEFDLHVNSGAAEDVHPGYLKNIDVPDPQIWLGVHFWKQTRRRSPNAWGAIGDGASHPLSDEYASLAAAQVIFPHAVALTDEFDWAAWQKVFDLVDAQGYGHVEPDEGVYLWNREGSINSSIVVAGPGETECSIRSTADVIVGDVNAADDLLRVVPPAKVNGFRWEGVELDGNGEPGAYRVRDALHIDAPDGEGSKGVHDWLVAKARLQNAGRHGLYHNVSWKGHISDALAFANGVDGFHAGYLNSHNVQHECCKATSNGRDGIRPGLRSKVVGHTAESNGRANVYIGPEVDEQGRGSLAYCRSVVVDGGYYEGETAAWDSDEPKHHVLIEDSFDIQIVNDGSLERRGRSIMISGSRRVILDGLGSNSELAASGDDLTWAANEQTGVYVTADCEDISIGTIPPVPVHFEDPSKVARQMVRQHPALPDAFGGHGDFARDTDANGLSDGWRLNSYLGVSGTPSRTDDATTTGKVQRLEANGNYNGLEHDVTLKADTDYTLGVIVRTDGRLRVYENVNDQLGTGKINTNGEWRLVCIPFTTDATPPTHVGILAEDSGTIFDLVGAKLVEGTWHQGNFPMLGQVEPDDQAIITVLGPSAAVTWTNMPLAVDDLLGAPRHRFAADLTRFTQARITVRTVAAGTATAELALQYNPSGSTWVDAGPVASIAAANTTEVGDWVDLDPFARGDVVLRIGGRGGDGAVDPSIGMLTVQFR